MSIKIQVVALLLIFILGTKTKEIKIKYEPDYHHLLYGNVWRHTIYLPAAESQDVKDATKHLYSLLKQLQPGLEKNLTGLRCIYQNVLWYTDTGLSPLTYDSSVFDDGDDGLEHFVSVPISFGSTLTFVASDREDSSKLHTFLISRDDERQSFYLFSHTTYRMNRANKLEWPLSYLPDDTVFGSQGKTCSCTTDVVSNLPVLSSLHFSKNKNMSPHTACNKESVEEVDLALNSQNIYKMRKKGFTSENVVREKQDINKDKDDGSIEKHGSSKKSEDGPRNISIMTFNMWNFNHLQGEQYFHRMKRIQKVLEASLPDIVGFQEVRYDAASGGKLGPNQVHHLASALPGYQFVYQPAQLFKESFKRGRCEEGVAIFSKYPIMYHDYLLLFRNHSNSADSHQRICLHAVVDMGADIGRVHVYNTHLSLSHEAREASMQQILQFVCESSHGEPAFLLGDLNATPDEKAIRILGEDSSLFDVWKYLHPSSQGFTFNTLENNLSKRIDYIFMKKSSNVYPSSMEVLPDAAKLNLASDHRAVIATFDIWSGRQR